MFGAIEEDSGEICEENLFEASECSEVVGGMMLMTQFQRGDDDDEEDDSDDDAALFED